VKLVPDPDWDASSCGDLGHAGGRRLATDGLGAQKEPVTHELTIDGMRCEHCVKAVREALAKVPGVIRADVELDPAKVGHARVEGAVDRAVLVAVIEAEDYRVRPA
jgi:copper chaperone CopZ